MLISDDYRKQLQELHAKNENWGDGDSEFPSQVAQAASLLAAETILDYGAGKQSLKKSAPFWKIISYDPGIPGLSEMPDPCDLVVSRCVLEHVEPDKIDVVLDHIRGLARKGVLIVVSCFQSTQTLPDGRYAHLIVQPPDWWAKKLLKLWKLNTLQVIGQRLYFFGFVQ